MMVVRKLQGKKRCYIIVFFFSFLRNTPFILPYLFTLVLRSYYFFNSIFYYDSKPYRSIIFIISHFSEFTVILLIFACIHIHIFWHLNGDFWICRCGSIRVEWNKKREMFILQRQHLFAIPSITMGCFTVGKIFSCMHN